jgi:hypothetical protein
MGTVNWRNILIALNDQAVKRVFARFSAVADIPQSAHPNRIKHFFG